MSDLELIEESLTLAAERADDVVPLAYEHFFRFRPEVRTLFGRGALAQGKMFNETLQMLCECAAGAPYLHGVVEREVVDHRGYGVLLSMYSDYFEAILLTLRQAAGPEWRSDHEAAWRRQMDKLTRMVAQHAAELRMSS